METRTLRRDTGRRASIVRLLALLLVALLTAAACGSDDAGTIDETSAASDTADSTPRCYADPDLEPVDADVEVPTGTTIRLETHDSFAVSDGVLDAFTDETGIGVELVTAGDAGTMVSTAILTKNNPTADVLFGIDNTFMCRGLEAGLFVPYESPLLATVDEDLQLDPFHRLTPIDYGDVCANYWIDALPGVAPTSLDDLTAPENVGQFVTQNPETSSPGFAFLLATIARYGDDGWQDYWQKLVDNDVLVTADWETAYYGEFRAGGGDRSIVMSYASSPAAEVIFADPPVDAPPTGVLQDSCYRQVEFAGIVAGSDDQAASAKLIDYLLGVPFQEDIPGTMFVYPANRDAALPAVFEAHARLADDALQLDPALIERRRNEWTDRWVEIVLR